MLSSQVVAVLPDEPVATMMAPVEVMLQEGIQVFSLPAGDLERLIALRTVFGARGSFGVHGPVDPGSVDDLIAAGIEFALPLGPGAAVLAALREAGVPAAPDALTPTEIRAVWAAGADAVQVVPADIGSATYGPALAELVPGVPCLPRGGVGSYALRKWISAGAPAACLDEILVGDACTDAALPALRERCRSVLAVIADERA
ncbi:hypothetical protein JS278_02661 [Acidipropionibacterium virtanenii]|uniref:KHG/KDPG aldolase n=2 Tax=Acidipropionibacterium virtanenii TaxID=2057246 RepID=A0A344UX00_9ACTN|nr:hypothetical protein JS278_02661 [Acidipropionibacterium virtanenii]